MLAACLTSGVVHVTALAVLSLRGGSLRAPSQAERPAAAVTLEISGSAGSSTPHLPLVVAARSRGPAAGRRRPRPSRPPPTAVSRRGDRLPAPETPPPTAGSAPAPASGVRSLGARPVLSPATARALRVYDVYPAPPEPLRAGVVHVLLADICVSDRGLVSDVSMAPGGAAALESALRAAIRTWRYRPLLLDGVPTPFCHPMRFIYRQN
jgi:hypothetical protein